MGLEVGGSTAWKVRSRGEIAVAFHWVNGEPAIVLFPTNRHMRMAGAMPYVLPLSSAHELVNPGTGGEGVNTGVLIEKSMRATEVMGFGDDWPITRKVADALLDSIDDLIKMPPEPKIHADRVNPAPTGKLAVTVAGETIFEGEA